MAAYTSTQVGNWADTSTWGGSGPPIDGDTATLSHAVTVAADATLGTSPNNTTTFVVTISTNGSLTINTGVTLTCKGNISVAPSSVTAGVTINGNGKLLFDGSAIGTSRFYLLSCSTNGRLTLSGTDTNNRATVDAQAGGGCWQLGRVSVSLATSNWGLLNRCGDASNAGFTGLSSAGSGQTIDVQNTLFSNCGYVRMAATHATATILIQDVQFIGSVGTSTEFRGFLGASTTLNRVVFSGQITIYVAEQIACNNCYFGSKLQNISPSLGWKTGSSNNYIGHLSGSGLSWRGSMEGAYYFHNSADNENYILQNFFATTTGEVIADIVMDYGDTSPSQPDGMVIASLASGTGYLFARNIKLPDSVGTSSGALMNHFSGTAMEGAIAIEHNTYVSVGGVTQNGIYAGENANGRTGMITGLKSNLAWTPAGKTQGWKFKRHGTNVQQDFVTAANADYNWGWNLAAGSEGNGYEATTPSPTIFSTGTPDLNGGNGNPGFIDDTRNLVRFDIDRLGNSAGTAWADATAYVAGDVRSASDADYYDGETINWRCILAHTSASANATNGKPGDVTGFRTNWEPMSLFRLREDPTRITDLLAWVRGGFGVTNTTLNNAGHDGITIGAGAYVSLPPRGIRINQAINRASTY